MNSKNIKIWLLISVMFVLSSFVSGIFVFISDWLWFKEVGFQGIFITSLSAKILLGFFSAAIFFLFLSANIYIAAYSKRPWVTFLPEAVSGQSLSISQLSIKKYGIIISAAISVLIGLVASSQWETVLKFLKAAPFNSVDPIFGKDISFYIFSLPVIGSALSFINVAIIISIAATIAIYLLRGSLNLIEIIGRTLESSLRKMSFPLPLDSGQGKSLPQARTHLAVLLSFLFLVLAVGTYFSMFRLLTNESGAVFGAVFADVNIRIPLIWISVGAAVFASIASLYWGRTGKIGSLFAGIAIYFIIGLSSSVIVSVVQQLIVAPNELAKETPYIMNNVNATRWAFGLNNIEEREISGGKPLTGRDIAKNNLTIKNVRLWDRGPLLSTFSQIQEIRTYYEFVSVDNDRYNINGEIRQIMLSPREMSSDSLPNKNWINEKLTFTHGYGVAAGPVNQVSSGGLPVLFVKDLPPQTDVAELSVSRPEIYYGELTNDYVIVKSKSKEFDYPKGEQNVYSLYQGSGGIRINSLLRKLLYSIRFGSLKLLMSNDITDESRILYHRNIQERLSKIAPFLTFDSDPYSVIADGKIYWIADAYTTSGAYPYSQPLQIYDKRVNYIRNSVKAVVDAFNGTVTLYIADDADPIIKTYEKLFPGSFSPISKMPKNLGVHIRYPEDIFTMQSHIYTVYHMDDPQIFYNKEDQWEIPQIPVQGEIGAEKIPVMTPRHMIMKLPSEKTEEYILMLPFTPRGKDNLSAWMVARNDGVNYGKLIVYRFPKQQLIFGPKQVIGRINQDSEISRQISLWDQRGSQVIQGSLLVIPIEESLIYVRPLYLKADEGKIPELKRVLVSYGNKIAMEETLELGLARIFGGPSISDRDEKINGETQSISDSYQEIIRTANQIYNSAMQAQRDGDWARYGDEMKKLGDILRKLH